ncbi:MAG: hypothetical protein KC503_12985 [Myxococcales bacterium]|nr:hypothetical protein [Myxococcales bacterium]
MIKRQAISMCACAVVALLVGCGDEQVITTTRNLERPGPVALVCAARQDGGIQMLPGDRCAKVGDTEPTGKLYGLVANTARGDVALFRAGETTGEPLVDLDRASPGFGFVPVGSLPTDMVTTRDGCRAVTANAGSCDLGLIDVPGVLDVADGVRARPSSGIVSRIVPRTAAGPLRARPRSIVLVPGTDPEPSDAATCPRPGAYRAYVTFPNCNLLAEIDLATGMIVRAAQITSSGVQYTTTPVCRPECAETSSVGGGDAQVDGAGGDAADAAPDAVADAAADAPADASVDAPGDSSVDSSADSTADAGASETTASDGVLDGGDALPADAGAADTTVDSTPPADGGADGAPGADSTPGDGAGDSSPSDSTPADSGPTGDGPVAQTTSVRGPQPWGLAISLDVNNTSGTLFVSSAGANFISVIPFGSDGAFGSARRLTLSGDQAQSTRLRVSPRAETLDDRYLYVITRDRSVRVISLKDNVECETNVDVARLSADIDEDQARCFKVGAASSPRRSTADGPGLRFGTRVPADVVFIQSAGSPSNNDAGVAEATPLRGLFALIATSDGTVFVVDIEDGNYVTGSGKVSRLHLPHRVRNGAQGTESGNTDAGVQSITGVDPGGTPVVVKSVGGQERAGQGVTLRGPGEAVRSEWNIVYEDALFERFAGQLRIEGDKLVLRDPGANYCTSGVKARREVDGRPLEHGDILVLKGCENDDECGLGQSCRKPVAQRTDFGLCLDLSRTDQLFRECSTFLSQPREFLVRAVDRNAITIDALPLEPQVVILQPSQPAGGCQSNGDCSAGYLCALRDRIIPGGDNYTVRQGQCFRPGCNSDADCASGSCVTPLDGSPKRCAPVPLPLETGGECQADADCKPASTGEACTSDRDCANNAECRAATSKDDKRCFDRGYTCSTFSGLKGRCVRPSPCFSELLRYEVRAGQTFLVGGNTTRQIADRATGQCIDDASKSPLTQSRLPVGMASWPVLVGEQCTDGKVDDLLAEPQPNPCFQPLQSNYEGISTTEGTTKSDNGAGTAIVRFSNADIAFALGVSHLSKTSTQLTPDAGVVAAIPAMPARGMTITLNVQAGYAPQVVSGAQNALSLPGRMIAGPDGRVYVVDSGDRTGNTGTNGQVLRFPADTLVFDNYLVK